MLTLLLVWTCCDAAWAQLLSFRQADSLLLAHSHNLQTARWDVAAAEGQLAQSRRYDNPTVSMMYNVRNPNNHRWLDAGKEGEMDVQVAQPLAIGGQHGASQRRPSSSRSSACGTVA